jgi:hypothetical protein
VAGQSAERFPQVGVVPVGTAVDHQQRVPGSARGLRDEQFHGWVGRHGHGAFAEHWPSLPVRWMPGGMRGVRGG